MGKWGTGLYDNDTSLDVRDQFETLFNDGKTVNEITEQLIEDFKSIMGIPYEESLFWFALADTQWNFGVLMPVVKEKALYWIRERGDGLEDWAIGDLKVKLQSPQPPVKMPVRKRLYSCEWKYGDVFAYRLESDLAKERNLYGRYFLIQKVDEDVWYPGHIVPIVYIKITKDTTLPSDINEYDELEYVQTWFSRYEDRFLPINMSCLKEDIERKSKMIYEVDEFGFLPQYRAVLLNTSKKVIPEKLIHVGNYANAVWPKKEFVPHSKDNIMTVSWKRFDETFETKMIKQYCGHNLRELSIYSK